MQTATVSTMSLMASLCNLQEHPAFRPASLDLKDKAVASAYASSEEQMSSWWEFSELKTALSLSLYALSNYCTPKVMHTMEKPTKLNTV